jgi:hypothetical protein
MPSEQPSGAGPLSGSSSLMGLRIVGQPTRIGEDIMGKAILLTGSHRLSATKWGRSRKNKGARNESNVPMVRIPGPYRPIPGKVWTGKDLFVKS